MSIFTLVKSCDLRLCSMGKPLEEEADFREPLLRPEPAGPIRDPENGSVAHLPAAPSQPVFDSHGQPIEDQCSITSSVFNLANTTIGAGIMALPRAFATLGIMLGTVMLVITYALSYFSLATIVRASEQFKEQTYADLVRSQFGRAGSLLLQLSIIINNAGIMIIYLIILGDVLVGVGPTYNGLITNALHIHSGDVWYVSRPFVLAVACFCVLGPLIALKSLRGLSKVSVASMVLALTFCGSMFGLAILAYFKGQVSDIYILPNPDMLGRDIKHILPAALGVMPVLMTAYICHFNLIPVMHSMYCPTKSRILKVVRRSLTVCTVAYLLIAIGGYIVFGSSTDGDVLRNITPENLTPLIGRTPAEVFCTAVRLAYCICLSAAFALVNWALRETLASLILREEHLAGVGFYALTCATLGVLYATAVVVPSIWFAMSLMGATASVTLGFIFPGLLATKLDSQSGLRMLLAYTMVATGVVTGVAGVLKTVVWDQH
ncbi:hypothetical protein WJX72_009225 [[Myrmecia] bisecta]|uniref:Amino acid transporter transmembrane domain-containing protein n=1 Tax=[Myrmecia] bisecta TaxID=41462 RepID=A0AAW1PQ25_9CHLO